MLQLLLAFVAVALSVITTNGVKYADDVCPDDPTKCKLLSFYEEWKTGFQVDYITVNELRDTYDFIVIGAGVGGSVVAHRLAMDSSYPSVLLLEAGGKHNTSGLSPELIPVLNVECQLTDIDWAYQSEPSEHCCKWMKDTRHQMPRGKVTGGSAVLNYMMWVRGHREDWDKLFDIEGWKWNDVLPYFMKTETLHTYNHKQKMKGRGYDGPIIVNDVRNIADPKSTFEERILEAAIDSGYFKFLENGQNTGDNIGIAYVEHNVDDSGHRNNAFLGYNKYLRKYYKKSQYKLDILPNAFVTKILFDVNTDTIKATGVEFADLSDNKKQYSVNIVTNGEIIVSGGAFNSPQLLMLSGLGPKQELQKHGIKVISDIPGIGNNLQDHIMTPTRYHFKPKYAYTEGITRKRVLDVMNNFTLFKDYLFSGKSVLSSATSNINAFLRSNTMNNKYGTQDTFPDLQFYWLAGWHGFSKYFNYVDDVYVKYQCGPAELWNDKANVDNIMALVGHQHPESRGYVKLASANPFDKPLIQPNYLKEQFDVDVLIEGVKIMNNIMNQKSIKELWDIKMDCLEYGDINNNDTALEAYIRDSIWNIYHPVGTCKMGDIENDKMAVIDNKLKVRGIQNLRVVDASIYPHQTSGNTQNPTYMAGEKAADMILKRWRLKH